MDIYLLAFNFIIADKLMGGIPSKVIEHLVINNVLALTWWSASKLLYGVGYLAMLPFTSNTNSNNNNNNTGEYSLVDTAFYNEYVIEHRDISPIELVNKDDITSQLTQNISIPIALNSDWEVVNKDDSKVILTNNKTAKQIIITKKEVDDMVVITKE
jgi:hypothetical protein